MLKNLKHTIVFILVVITLLLVVVMSLAAFKPVNQNEIKGTSIPLDSINDRWSGLGMNIFPSEDSYIDTVMANGFTELRHLVPYTGNVAGSKAKIISWIAKGAKVIWGVSAPTPITAANWPNFHTAILDAAQWAQDNGVYEFQIGNEEENHVDRTTMTAAQIRLNMKSTATEVQKIFTRGNVSYACSDNYISDWISAGKGDIDILAANVYRGGGPGTFSDDWKTHITNMVNAFGPSGTCLTEFSVSWVSLESYSTDESVQAAGVSEMIDYIKASGMTRAFYFAFKDDGDAHFGALKNDGTYRLLWDVLIGSDSTVLEDTTTPNITGLSNDTTPTDSKTWTWDADEPATFRYLIDDKPDSVPTGDYSDTKTDTQSGVDGTYYIHVQVKDAAGNESEVVTVSAILVSAIPDTTTPEIAEQSNDTTTPNIAGLSNDTSLQENDPVKAFVARFYQECLDRSPDNGGLNGWADKLASGAKTGANVAYGFVFSDEFKQKNVSNEEYITILYRVCFNREPDIGGYNCWLDHLNNGKSRKWVLARFIKSKEFKNLCAAYGIKPGSI
jgi:hypothetical protein